MLRFICSCGSDFQLNATDNRVVPVPYFGKASKGTKYYTRCQNPNCKNVIMVFRKNDFGHVCNLVEVSSE